MKLYELAYASNVFKILRNYNNAYLNFLSKTAPSFNICSEEHLEALFEWLNKWGCRLDKNYKGKFKRELKSWYDKCEDSLPPPDVSLLDISDAELVLIAEAYEELRIRDTREAPPKRSIGATCASKILYALRSGVCPPWDTEMRRKWKYTENAESYRKFLVGNKGILNQLEGECQKYGFNIKELPQKIYGHQSSLIRLLNEYNFVKVRETQTFKMPDIEVIEKWYQWARE